MSHYMPCTGIAKWCVYVRAAVGLVGRDVAEALSRGSEEGSRKLVVGCFLSTWPCPSSSKPDSTPCCLLCLLLSSRSFPKNASWTWQHKALVTSLWQHFPPTTLSLPFSTSVMGNTSPCHTEIIQHTLKARENWPKWNREALKLTVMLVLTSLLSAPTSPNHSYPQVIYYPQRHVAAAPCCNKTLKAQRVGISIINEMCFTVLDL